MKKEQQGTPPPPTHHPEYNFSGGSLDGAGEKNQEYYPTRVCHDGSGGDEGCRQAGAVQQPSQTHRHDNIPAVATVVAEWRHLLEGAAGARRVPQNYLQSRQHHGRCTPPRPSHSFFVASTSMVTKGFRGTVRDSGRKRTPACGYWRGTRLGGLDIRERSGR